MSAIDTLVALVPGRGISDGALVHLARMKLGHSLERTMSLLVEACALRVVVVEKRHGATWVRRATPGDLDGTDVRPRPSVPSRRALLLARGRAA